MSEYSAYQQKVIKRYYDNRDSISLQRLQELVTDLYLADGKKLAQLWKNAEKTLAGLKIPPARAKHLLEQKNPALLAKLVEELMASGG